MSKYLEGKEKARNEAVNYQADFPNHNYSYEQLAVFSAYFERKARKYGLVKEFKNEGII